MFHALQLWLWVNVVDTLNLFFGSLTVCQSSPILLVKDAYLSHGDGDLDDAGLLLSAH